MEVLSRQARGKGQKMYFDQKEMGRRIRETRKFKGWTQEELADRLNISREHIGRIERGVYGCSLDLLVELSCVLSASTDYLLMGRTTDREKERKQVLAIIGQLSEIAREL